MSLFHVENSDNHFIKFINFKRNKLNYQLIILRNRALNKVTQATDKNNVWRGFVMQNCNSSGIKSNWALMTSWQTEKWQKLNTQFWRIELAKIVQLVLIFVLGTLILRFHSLFDQFSNFSLKSENPTITTPSRFEKTWWLNFFKIA